ncbi:uncharacterized protein SPSC_03445 [Sporisorium scitamineum]|uniref:Uncharacterized protein n=1 Tax=Sporisorium scitamineum TaxID=49012 RepID=A0A0F7RVE9_9BASI|nr:uncharacterized protein SPSC_03445 [Sporisorium scitamineum]CDR99074.1 hypothetical protein [Sporisorium scitamineum]
MSTWIYAFLGSGCQVQQTFCAYSDESAQPYDLSEETIWKRADIWASALGVLVHVFLDGVELGYFNKLQAKDHLNVNCDIADALVELQALYYDANKSTFVSLDFMSKYAYVNSNSASAHLQSLHRYGTVLAQDDSMPFTFSWAHDLSSIKFGTEEIPVDHLQALMHGAQQQAEKLLLHLCLLPPDSTLSINLKHVLDDHRNMQPGFNFAAISPELSMVSTVLVCTVPGNVPITQPLMDPYAGELEFDADATNVYFKVHNEFVKLLAVLIELGSGLPARGTELLQLQHTNTLSGLRNIFVHNGSVFIALPTNKGVIRVCRSHPEG